MTNLRKFSGIIAIAAFFIVLTGCKKDDDTTTRFSIVGDTSYHFEYGQTREISYSVLRITKISVGEVPDGWTCIHTGGKFVITAPAQGTAGAATGGTVKVSATTQAGTTLSRDITVAIKIATEITGGAANCFIVSTPGGRYKFNATRRGNSSTVDNALKAAASGAARLWSTSKTALVNVSFENDYIYFALAEGSSLVEGNAVLALTDKDNNVLWSWHIWITDFDPADAPDDMGGGVKVMNRNIGAFANSFDTPENLARTYGLYYQWGRKDPFAGPDKWNSSATQTLYNSAGSAATYTFVKSTTETGTMDYAIAHPNVFIAGAVDSDNKPVNDFDWLFSGQHPDLWSTTAKTVNDPCPAGWRVAPPTIWASFTVGGESTGDPSKFNVEGDATVVFDNNDTDATNDWYGWTFKNGTESSIFYPAAGRRSFSPSMAASTKNFSNIVNDGHGNGLPVGFYWSSRHPIGNEQKTGALVFTSTYAYDAGDNRTITHYINPAYTLGDVAEHSPAGGFPLRCVAE